MSVGKAGPKSETADAPPPFGVPVGESTEPAEEGAPAWMTTFSDLMSLLLTFFVLMYSMSEIKIEKFALARASLSQAFTGAGMVPTPTPGSPTPKPAIVPRTPTSSPAITPTPADVLKAIAVADAYLDEIARRLQAFIDSNNLRSALSVVRNSDGVRLRILSTALFPSGSAVISTDSHWVVEVLGKITASLDVPVVVSGHTDDAPIQTSQFRSNWELSAARAAGIARELVEGGRDPLTVRAEGFGEYRPIAANDTPDGRALNRRVEIHFSRDEALRSAHRWIEEGRDAPADAAEEPAGGSRARGAASAGAADR